MNIEGRCHCGNVGFTLAWPGEDQAIPARACGCTFCTKHGGVWTSNPGASLTVRVGDEALHAPYRFGHGTAQFHVCARCGVVPVVTSEIDGEVYAVVNVNTFEGIDRESLSASPTDFDGEDSGSRLERRQRNWIPEVRFESSR